MSGTAVYSSRVEIARVRAQYLVPADHPHPEDLKAHLDTAATVSLQQTLGSILELLCPATDERVWLIRRLDLDMSVNAAWDRNQVAKVWGQAVSQSLYKTLHAGADGDAVVCFPNRPAYLARFVLDCATGWAWGRWYYNAFQGLRLLPTSAAIRTAILDHRDTGLAALHYLASSELDTVLSSLSEQDARLLLECLARSDHAVDDMAAFRAAWTAWQDSQQWHDDMEVWRTTLGLFLSASRATPGIAGPALLQNSRALVCLTACLRQHSHAEALASALMSGDVATLYTVAGAANGEALLPFLHCSVEWVKEVTGALSERRMRAQAAQIEAERDVRHTPFGGLFLLLPLLDAIPADEAAEGWPVIEQTSAAAIVRCLLFVKCCGHVRAQRVFNDPLVRDMFSISPSCTIEALVHWQRRITPQHLKNFMTRCGQWQRQRQLAPSSHYLLTTVRTKKRAVVLMIEKERGLWLSAEQRAVAVLPAIFQRMMACVSADERRQAMLLYDRDLTPDGACLEDWQHVLSLPSAEADALARQDVSVDGMAAEVETLAEEMRYLELPKSFRVRHALGLALTVVAQQILRTFARRLPGYGRSQLPYLYRNFLNCSATVEEEHSRRVVRLGHAPLQLMLNLTGLSRATYTVSWLDDRPVILFPGTEN